MNPTGSEGDVCSVVCAVCVHSVCVCVRMRTCVSRVSIFTLIQEVTSHQRQQRSFQLVLLSECHHNPNSLPYMESIAF